MDEAWAISPEPETDILAIDQALDALGTMYPRTARVVELRFFGGLNVEETAAGLEVSEHTVGATGGWRGPGCRGNSGGRDGMDRERARRVEALSELALQMESALRAAFP